MADDPIEAPTDLKENEGAEERELELARYIRWWTLAVLATTQRD